MSHFNLLEAKITDNSGKDILIIEGQLKRLLVKPPFQILITKVERKDGFVAPYKPGDTCPLSEFVEKLYKSHFSLSEPSKYPNVEIQINIKRVYAIIN